MIEELHIRNLGVIEQADVSFATGMTALTGETGAGKTMALTSLSLLMGGKAESQRVRVGADKAIVEGTFVVASDSPAIDVVREAGGDVDLDGDTAVIYVARHVPPSGRSRAFVGGHAVPVSVLHELATHLVTVHGQADQIRLRSQSAQREALDAFGGAEITNALASYGDAWSAYTTAKEAYREFEANAKTLGQQRLALEALVARVDSVKPQAHEDQELKALAQRLDNVEEIRSALAHASFLLDGSENEAGATARIDEAASSLAKLTAHDPELQQLVEQLRDEAIVLADVSVEILNRLRGLDADPERLNQIHARRAELNSLQRDLAMSLEEIIEARAHASTKLASFKDPTAYRETLQRACDEAQNALRTAGKTLSDLREKAAQRLADSVNRELAELAMKDATFSIILDPLDAPSRHGMDDVSFRLSPHRGAAPMALGATASGGEMSRIMLALEVTLAGANPPADHTFIFDEIDAGIGGKTALSVGKRLADLGDRCQVITVTHLAQVAAYARQHIVVEKDSAKTGAVTDVRLLSTDERERELARMLSGHDELNAARTHAAELLQVTGVTR